MSVLFKSDFHNAFGTWPLAYIPYGGADFGEVQAVAKAVGEGDDGVFHSAFVAAGDRLAEEAESTLAAGHRGSARDLFLRASVFYGASLHPLYGAPVDPRFLSAFHRQVSAFDRGLALGEPAVRPVRIPFEGAAMTAYLLPAAGRADEVRPLLILTNGYDGTITDMYFASGVAASRRGYHVLMFDGPGQGEMLYVQGVPMRADWETVIRAVVNYAIGLPQVDAKKMALSGWSLGGYLAPRGASGEPRIAALIADPGQWGIAAGVRGFIMRVLGDVSDVTPALVEKLRGVIEKDRRMRWSIIQRGFWVHGVDSLQGFLHAVEPFTMEGRAELIRCPTLLTAAEDDPLSSTAQHFYEALRCPKKLIRFTAAEGAGDHCEMMNRSLLNRRVFDWLDDIFGMSG
ncbi:MAG: alpha/beta fold hydrolase [Rhizobiaceae bacterium]|nr:alpha/beta fold hydrolase [Rhizobiaceae bacterium]